MKHYFEDIIEAAQEILKAIVFFSLVLIIVALCLSVAIGIAYLLFAAVNAVWPGVPLQ